MSAEGPVSPVTATEAATGPNIYLVLLDGYPRRDTLMNDMGIDNGPFEEALTERGFDVYDDAHTDRRYTDLTLMTLLTGSTEGVPDDTAPASEVQWLIRRALSAAELPRQAQAAGYEWDVIDSPAGHVTFSAGHHIQHGGVNTFEDNMLAESIFGPSREGDSCRTCSRTRCGPTSRGASTASSRWRTPMRIGSCWRTSSSRTCPSCGTATGDPVPVPSFWPRVNIFAAQIETMGMTPRRLLGRDEGRPRHAQPEAAGDGRRRSWLATRGR